MRINYLELIEMNDFIISKKMEIERYLDSIGYFIKYFVELDSFDGEAARALKLYMQEVHSYILTQFKMVMNEIVIKNSIYIGEYLTLDTQVDAVLDTETLNKCSNDMNDFAICIEDYDESINNALANISDVFSAASHNIDYLVSDFDFLGKNVCVLEETINVFEESEYENNVLTLKDYVDDVEEIISEIYSKSESDIRGYTAGGIKELNAYNSSYENLGRSMIYTSANSEKMADACTLIADANKQILDEKHIEEKKGKSLIHYVRGTFCSVSGVGVIIVTSEITVPVVVGVGIVISSADFAYAFSEYYVATEELIYVINNEPDKVAFCPLRDTYFSGDEEAYNKTMDLFVSASGLYEYGIGTYEKLIEKEIEQAGEYAFISTVEKKIGNDIISVGVDYGIDFFQDITGIEMDDWIDELIDNSLNYAIDKSHKIPLLYK